MTIEKLDSGQSYENTTDVVAAVKENIERYDNKQNKDTDKIRIALDVIKLFNSKKNETGETFKALKHSGVGNEDLRDLDQLIFGHRDGHIISLYTLLFDFIKDEWVDNENEKSRYVPASFKMRKEDNVDVRTLDEVMGSIKTIINKLND